MTNRKLTVVCLTSLASDGISVCNQPQHCAPRDSRATQLRRASAHRSYALRTAATAPNRNSRRATHVCKHQYVKFYYGYFTEDYELHLEMAEFGPDGFVGYHYGDGTGFNGQVFTPVTDDYDDGRNRVW